MIDRRTILKGVLTGAGAAIAPPVLPQQTFAKGSTKKNPKRVVFFLQNHAFHESQCTPTGAKHGDSIANRELPEYIRPLEPYKEKITVVNGLHGVHTTPAHSAYFGALGGYRKCKSNPRAETIDSALSRILPRGPLQQLCIGMETLNLMRNRPVFHGLTATAPGLTTPMICDPRMLYQSIFGCAVDDPKARLNFKQSTEMLKRVGLEANKARDYLSGSELNKYLHFPAGCKDVLSVRQKLATMADHLAKFAPKYDDNFSRPEFETQWHHAIFDVGIAALKAGVTSTMTVAQGCGEIGGSYEGIGVKQSGHSLGHSQPSADFWPRIHQHNTGMLVKLMEELKSVPEDEGTMLDHTLIVYTSNNGNYQHTDGANWPYLLIGDFGGTITTGHYFDFSKTKRPINALYATLLAAVGQEVEHFNMEGSLIQQYDPGSGPLSELLT